MTCLEKPLYPTVISTLRDLSRECARLRTLTVRYYIESNNMISLSNFACLACCEVNGISSESRVVRESLVLETSVLIQEYH